MKTPPASLALALSLFLAALLATRPAEATTWAPVERTCPLCAEVGTYKEPMSWGSYIYRYPSRLQYVFWPATESRAVYSCTGCRFTCFMWDFKTPVPAGKREALTEALKKVELVVLEPREGDDTPPLPYLRIDPLAKLAAAEVVYRALGTKSDAEWSQFYRAFTYQALKAKDDAATRRAAQRCVEVTARLAEDPAREGLAKQDRTVLGAMHRVLGQWEQAREQLAQAAALTYADPENERSAGVDEYLTELIADLQELVAKESQPPAGSRDGDAPGEGD